MSRRLVGVAIIEEYIEGREVDKQTQVRLNVTERKRESVCVRGMAED